MAKKSDKYKKKFNSKEEEEIYNLLLKINPVIKVYPNYPYAYFTSTTNERLTADIFIDNYRMAIEYNGPYHSQPIIHGGNIEEAQAKFENQKSNDKLKRKLCNDNAIKLIEIDYTEWEPLNTEDEKLDFLYERLFE